ncbi:hypothetical protein K501DRAFT_330258 [Backusella circina FSU 941]|nr:hypothetical protein K501DRAFT_330258 [Backusella circina FSU 941]
MSDSLSQSLSRLALAKAIKTPYEDDKNSEGWSKSIIFCQPFVEEMEEKAHNSSLKHTQHKDKKLIYKKHQAKPQQQQQQQQQQRQQIHHQQQPKALDSPIPKQYKNKSRSHLPSDSDDSETSDKRLVPRKNPCPTAENTLQSRPKVRPTSYEDGTRMNKGMSHSRASSSSSATPLTEDDQVPEEYFRKHSLNHIPNDDKDTYYNRRSIKEIDLYYQQLYQQQLQYQLALQQQQQMYYAQPVYFASPRVEDNKRHSPRHHHQHHRPTSTDLRRRAEMMRSSSDSNRHLQGKHGHFV